MWLGLLRCILRISLFSIHFVWMAGRPARYVRVDASGQAYAQCRFIKAKKRREKKKLAEFADTNETRLCLVWLHVQCRAATVNLSHRTILLLFNTLAVLAVAMTATAAADTRRT